MKAQVCSWLLDHDLCFLPFKKQSWEQWPIQITNFFPKRQVQTLAKWFLAEWGGGRCSYFVVAPSSIHTAAALAPGPLSFLHTLSFKGCCPEPWCWQDADRKSPLEDKGLMTP